MLGSADLDVLELLHVHVRQVVGLDPLQLVAVQQPARRAEVLGEALLHTPMAGSTSRPSFISVSGPTSYPATPAPNQGLLVAHQQLFVPHLTLPARRQARLFYCLSIYLCLTSYCGRSVSRRKSAQLTVRFGFGRRFAVSSQLA